MRTFLLWFGWLSLVGSIFDGLITVFLGALIILGDAEAGITVDAHLKTHLHFIYWVKDVAYVVMPDPFVDWLFGLPAMIYFPVRVVTSVIIGGWALRAAARMKDRRRLS